MEPKTQEDGAYLQLRELIVEGELPVGEFLSQRMLASRVDAAVITVRGALRRLENDGLIENVPRWGVRIPEETEADMRDRYFMRETLEVAALARLSCAFEAGWSEELLGLARRCDGLDGSSAEDIRAFAEAHLAFHRYLPERCGSPLLGMFLERLNFRSLIRQNAQRAWARGVDRRSTYHEALASVLVSGDVRRGADALRTHIRRGLELELAVFGEDGKAG